LARLCDRIREWRSDHQHKRGRCDEFAPSHGIDLATGGCRLSLLNWPPFRLDTRPTTPFAASSRRQALARRDRYRPGSSTNASCGRCRHSRKDWRGDHGGRKLGSGSLLREREIAAISTLVFDSCRSRCPSDLSKSAQVQLSKNAKISGDYKFRTKTAKYRALEKTARRERISGLSASLTVQRFAG
jgi:hypothetical protein